jgi:phage-related protein
MEERRTIGRGQLILLHGFITKTQKTPADIELALRDKRPHERGSR